MLEEITTLDPLELLRADLRRAAATLTPSEVRYLVDYYYEIQEGRKRADNQMRDLLGAGEPHQVIQWLSKNTGRFEGNIKLALGAFSQASPVGVWAESIVGIGPIISAGLLAHIDIEKAPTVGHIWRFAGLDPTDEWNKGEKRPWNARLKVLCWKVGESFVKVSGNPQDFYGHLYLERKVYEQKRNDAGELAEQAAEKLRRFKIGKDTEAFTWYSQGKLPPAHIHARAKRWAVKLFLAGWQHVAYEVKFGKCPPKPYILTQPTHSHEIAVPNWH